MKSEKITDSRRKYEDACGAAHALELVGERWALLVMRELMFGPRRFSDLRSGLPGISANVLTQRLEGLEAAGIVRRRRLPPPAAAQVYELTPWGREADEVLRVLGRWAARSPKHDPTLPLSAASLMLSFGTMLDRERVGEPDAQIGFRIGRDAFVARLGYGEIAIERDEPEGVDVLIEGSAEMIAAAVYGGRPLGDAIRDGSLRVTGDQALAERFVTLFPLPEKAA